MKVYHIQLESLQPFIMTKKPEIEKPEREKHEEFDIRTWREKGHYTPDEHVKIPGVMFKRSLESAAKYLKEKIPGQRMATYSKPFLSAIQVVDDIVLPETKETVQCVTIHCHSDGRRGSGSRVFRRFPMVPKWNGELIVYVGDEVITPDVLERHVRAAGQFIGIGGFRAENGNQSGRFRIRMKADGTPMIRAEDFAL